MAVGGPGTAPRGPGGTAHRLLQVAPTRLNTYLDCPRRYRFAYLDRPPPAKGPPWAHNSLGAAVHTALANWWKLAVRDRTPAGIERLLGEAWRSDGFRDEAQERELRELAAGWLRTYVGRLDPYDEPYGLERTVGVTTERAALYGRVDRIDQRRRGELTELVVVDYKTSRQLLTVDDARTSVALAVYAAATERSLRRPCRRVELHHLPSGQVLAWDHTAESLERQLRRVDSLVAEIADVTDGFHGASSPEERDELFPTRVGPLCAWCDFNGACVDGSAIRPRDPWSGVEPTGAGHRYGGEAG